MLSQTPLNARALRQDLTSFGSDTGDVVISSTQEHENVPGSVQITVQKLRDPEPLQPRAPPHGIEPQQGRQRTGQRPDRGHLQRAEEEIQTGPELLTSHFTPGGRQAVLGALKQRSHSAPHRREVRVQLLDPKPLLTTTTPNPSALSCQDADAVVGVQSEARSSFGYHGDTSSNAAAAAAAAAAAVAAAAPIIKAQSDLEAQVSHLSDGVNRLLRTNSREAEDRGWSMSQQTLQLQSQLLESALRIVAGHASTTPEPSASADRTRGQQPISSTTDVEAVPMETRRQDRTSEQSSRDELHLQSVFTPEASHPQTPACHSQEAVMRANEMLRRMGSLAAEMKVLLTQPENSPKSTSPAPEPLQVQEQQLQPHQDQFQSHQSQSHQDQPSRNYSLNNQHPIQPSHFHLNKSLQSHQYQFPSQNSLSHQTTSQQYLLRSADSLFHRKPSRQNQVNETQFHLSQAKLVQKRPLGPSMLEEAGEVLLQAQRQKKVLEENLEAQLKAKTGEILHCQLEALAANRDWTEEVRIKKTVDAWINTLTSDIQAEVSPMDASGCRSADTQQRAAGKGRPVSTHRATSNPVMEKERRRQPARKRKDVEPGRVTGKLMDGPLVEVNREVYVNHMYSEVPYQIQTRTLNKKPYLHFSSPASPLGRKPHPSLVEGIRGIRLKSNKTQARSAPPLSPSPTHESAQLTLIDSFPVAMAIPLGRPRTEFSSKMEPSSRCEHALEAISALTAPVSTSVVTVGNSAPDQQKQHLDENQTPSAPSHVVILKRDSEEDEEDEEHIFPGANSLFVADVVQEEEGEEAVVLDGGPSPTPVLYHGPAFPPEAPHSGQVRNQTPVPSINPPQDILENRLVEWVSQQLMSRMVAEFYQPALSDPAHSDYADQSELKEQSLTSDIVEAAGGGGLQLFVDSNTDVDSDLIRKLVNEVLTETVAQMLGQKDLVDAEETGPGQPKPEPRAENEEKQLPLVPTPVPSPLPSLAQLSREATPVTTPCPSEPLTPLSMEPPPPNTAADLLATPTATPEPLLSETSPPADQQSPHPSAWGDTEVLLDEERPDEHQDVHRERLWMSVAEEEPLLCTPLPPTLPPAHAPPSTSSEESSSCSISSTVTAGTDVAMKHISEGELLISINQPAAVTAEDEAICSFSSSLQELHDMDFDPPMMEQIRGRNLLLTLLTKLEQGVSQPEGSWGQEEEEEEVSVGEMRDYEATKAERNSDLGWQDPSFSPGQTAAGPQEEKQEGSRKMEGPLTCVPLQEEVIEEPLSAAEDSYFSNNIF